MNTKKSTRTYKTKLRNNINQLYKHMQGNHFNEQNKWMKYAPNLSYHQYKNSKHNQDVTIKLGLPGNQDKPDNTHDRYCESTQPKLQNLQAQI